MSAKSGLLKAFELHRLLDDFFDGLMSDLFDDLLSVWQLDGL